MKRTIAAPCSAGVGDRLELLRLRHQQRRRLCRAGPPAADGDRRSSTTGRARRARRRRAPHAIENLAVAAVQAVEVAEREHRMDPPRRTDPRGSESRPSTRRSTQSSQSIAEKTCVLRVLSGLSVHPVISKTRPIISQLHAGRAGARRSRRGARSWQMCEVGALGAEPCATTSTRLDRR